MDRLRALVVPARGRARARARGRRAAEPRAGPPRPARHVRALPRREAARSSSGRGTRSCRAGSGSKGSSSRRTTRCPRSRGIPGRHNRANAAAATAAARAVGIADDAIAEALATFPGVPHRLELVRERDGVRWVNDSIATNTLRRAARRRGVRRAGAAHPRRPREGRGLRAVRARAAAERRVDLPRRRGGRTSSRPRSTPPGVAYERAGTLARAVELAAGEAQPGDVVLLSPACASYDQYANFEERGEDFRRLVANAPLGSGEKA